MACYFDTSALVKRYVLEAGSDHVMALIATGQPIYIARITAVEMISALIRRQRTDQRATRGAGMKSPISQIISAFRAEYASDAFLVVEISRPLIDEAMRLSQKHHLRGYDAVQLAAAMRVNHERAAVGAPSLVMVCADGELADAARAEKLPVDVPA